MAHIEISDDQWTTIEGDYERHQRDEARRLGFVEINLMEELKKDWRARGELDGEIRDMSDWTCSDTVEGNGYFWTNSDETVSAFEDTSEGTSQWYAWNGSMDDHDTATQTAIFPTRDEAVAALD